MTVGYPLNKQILDTRLGFLTKTLDDTLEGFVVLKTVLDGMTDAQLEDSAAGFGYSTDDLTVLRGIAAAMAKLRNIAHGQDTQAAASDFFFFAPKVTALD